MMDRFTALIAAIEYRDHTPHDDPIRNLSDGQILNLINNRTPGRPKGRGSIDYRDPTGDEASANADRRR